MNPPFPDLYVPSYHTMKKDKTNSQLDEQLAIVVLSFPMYD
ncbi:hypothetical protein DB29_00341 [Shouchella clausii]|nr:hypothetical protein DB29_00341 [Shouchella clausii]